MREGVASEDDIELGIETALRRGVPLGQALVASRGMAPVLVLRALVDQIRDRFVALGRMRSGEFAFVSGARPFAEAPPPKIPTEALVVDLCRRWLSNEELTAGISAFSCVSPPERERFGLHPEELRSLVRLTKGELPESRAACIAAFVSARPS